MSLMPSLVCSKNGPLKLSLAYIQRQCRYDGLNTDVIHVANLNTPLNELYVKGSTRTQPRLHAASASTRIVVYVTPFSYLAVNKKAYATAR